MAKTIVVHIPGFTVAIVHVADETHTIASLQPEIRSQKGLAVTDFVHLGFYRRVEGSPEIVEIVLVPNNMTVLDAYDLFIQQTNAPDQNILALVGDIGVVLSAPPA